jgi:predicted permease
MSPCRSDQKGIKKKRQDIDLEEVSHFISVISICSGALMIFSLIAFLLTGRRPQTDVIYALVIGINAVAFAAGRFFVKKFGNRE